MKYLMMIKHAESYRGEPIPQALMDAMGEFVTESFKSGVLKDTAGLKPTAEGFRVRSSKGQLKMTVRPAVHGAAPRALAVVRRRVRGAAARRHVAGSGPA